jgi:hypothetical protein
MYIRIGFVKHFSGFGKGGYFISSKIDPTM